MNRQIQKVMFSSQSGDWRTPQDLFDQLDKEFRFTRDVCADPEHPLSRHIMPSFGREGLKISWKESTCFMNPPYGREIEEWVEKAKMEAYNYRGTLDRVTTVGLLPARTDTNWFWDNILIPKFEIRLIRGRLKFEKKGYSNSAPFPSMIVIFR